MEILISDKPSCFAVERAKKEKIDVFAFDSHLYKNKNDFETEILKVLKIKDVDFIILAGYMRIVGPLLLEHYPKRIINIHPSLLPKYKGKDAIGQAIEAKESIIGITIHYVNNELDSGEIISQENIDISNLKSREEIEAQVHNLEHILYPKSIQKVLEECYEKSIN
jgi:phosphoribosylglycinamide formyltransferase-1